MHKILFCLSIISQIYSHSNFNQISLRPKPKARAGGANKKAAPIFSFSFFSEVYIGSNGDLFTLSVSVLQDGIWVMNPDCADCKLSTTQYNFSSAYSMQTSARKEYQEDMLHIDAEGQVYMDSVSLLDFSPVDFPVIVCDKFVDVYNMAVDGILGLGSGKDSIVYKMYESQIIDKPIYSLSQLTSPYLTLGTPNFLSLHLVVQGQRTISIRSPLNVTSFRFGDLMFNESISASLNSFSSYITGPFKYLANVFKKLTKLGCHFEEELLMCQCGSKKYPDFIFYIQGIKYTISSSDYLIQLGDNCFVGFKSGKKWILGEPFFKSYFLMFDLESLQMTSFKTTTLGNDLPSPFQTTEGWATMILLAVCLVMLYVIAFMIFLAYETFKLRQSERLNLTKKKNRIL